MENKEVKIESSMEERFEEMKENLFAVKREEWWSSDEDFILSFIQSEINLARAEERLRAVELIKDFRFYDWSGEQEIYNQVGEIIERINQND